MSEKQPAQKATATAPDGGANTSKTDNVHTTGGDKKNGTGGVATPKSVHTTGGDGG